MGQKANRRREKDDESFDVTPAEIARLVGMGDQDSVMKTGLELQRGDEIVTKRDKLGKIVGTVKINHIVYPQGSMQSCRGVHVNKQMCIEPRMRIVEVKL